jgi:hypothetical protein
LTLFSIKILMFAKEYHILSLPQIFQLLISIQNFIDCLFFHFIVWFMILVGKWAMDFDCTCRSATCCCHHLVKVIVASVLFLAKCSQLGCCWWHSLTILECQLFNFDYPHDNLDKKKSARHCLSFPVQQ